MNAFSRLLCTSVLLTGCGDATIGAFAPDGGTSNPQSANADTSMLDGTWDIISLGDSELKPSQMTVSAGKVTGVIVYDIEGQTSQECQYTKYRTEFTVQVKDGKTSGVIHRLHNNSCSGDSSRSKLLTGSRAESGRGDLGGEWNVQYDDDDPFAVLIDGLAAKAWDLSDRAQGKSPTVNVVVAGNLVTVTSKNGDYELSARRR